jgi:hypothetical protein
MNKVSAKKKIIKTFFRLSFLSAVSIIFLFIFPSKGPALASFMFVISQLYLIIIQLNIADIEFNANSDHVTFTYLFKNRIILNGTIKLFGINVSRAPAFRLETNLGNIYIHYTKTNYNILLNYLSFINYPNISYFTKKVRMNFSQPN